jgi:ferrous iron transport protein A
MNLAQLAVGESGRVVSVGAAGALKRRLMDMGLLAGVTVKVERVAPLGDPLEVSLRGYQLSLRAREAESVELEAAS